MYHSTKENKGNYTITTFIKRGLQLTSFKEFNRFRKSCLPQLGRVNSFMML